MTYVVKVRGALVVAEYECPLHGRFTLTIDPYDYDGVRAWLAAE